jgi:hypothetical protein
VAAATTRCRCRVDLQGATGTVLPLESSSAPVLNKMNNGGLPDLSIAVNKIRIVGWLSHKVKKWPERVVGHPSLYGVVRSVAPAIVAQKIRIADKLSFPEIVTISKYRDMFSVFSVRLTDHFATVL